MEKALVSIITPCYNGEKYLERYFNSILNQTYSNLELIFVDDGSTDCTRKIAEAFSEKFVQCGIDFKYLYQKNAGQASALNRGLKLFKGEYLTWPDSDDEMTSDCIELKVRFLESHRDLGMVRCNGVYINKNNERTRITQANIPESEDIFKDLLLVNTYGCCGCYMLTSKIFLECYPDRTIYESRAGQNWQLLVPAASRTKCGYIDRDLYLIYEHDDSHSRKIYSINTQYRRMDEFTEILKNAIRVSTCDQEIYINLVEENNLRQKFYIAISAADKEMLKDTFQKLCKYGNVTLKEKMLYIKHVKNWVSVSNSIYSLVYSFYFYLKRREKKCREQGETPGFWNQRLLHYAVWVYNVLVVKWFLAFPDKKYGLNQTKRTDKIIVSLTSYPKRIDTIWITIETLFRQSIKADEVILWLARSQFEDIDSIPENLLNLRKRGLKIRFCDDLRSHKKYFYALQEYKNDIVILTDDDMFYPLDTIQQLMKMHRKWPKDICCMSAQVIHPGLNSMPSGWRNPLLSEQYVHSDKLQIYTGSGSLYPPGSLDASVSDKNTIQKICPYADDLWLTFMAIKKGTRISSYYKWRAFPIAIDGTAKDSLWYINAEAGENDTQWRELLKHFKL